MSLDVAAACGVTAPVLVPGNIGAKAATRTLLARATSNSIEVGNEWGFVLDLLHVVFAFETLLVVGHPGKLAKLARAMGHAFRAIGSGRAIRRPTRPAQFFDRAVPEMHDGEGVFAALAAADERRWPMHWPRGSARPSAAASATGFPVAVLLVDMAGQCLGTDGDLSPWQ